MITKKTLELSVSELKFFYFFNKIHLFGYLGVREEFTKNYLYTIFREYHAPTAGFEFYKKGFQFSGNIINVYVSIPLKNHLLS